MMHLWCMFYVSRPLFSESQLDGLQDAINEFLPEWSVDLSVAKSEDSRTRTLVGRTGRLFDCVHEVSPPKRRLGHAALTGAYQGLSFFMDHFETTLPLVSNEIAVEVYERTTVENRPVSPWARDIFTAITRRLKVRYANARMNEEFSAKNMIEDEMSAAAIGVNITRAIPGLYWLNYFEAPYVQLIGRERLLTAPAYEVKAVGDGVLIALDASAESWQTSAYREREQNTIAHLGTQFFFSRWEPDRETVAPDFRAFGTAGDAGGC